MVERDGAAVNLHDRRVRAAIVLSAPPFLLAQVLIWGYVAARAAHFLAYVTAQLHDVRATFWSLSSISVIAMVGYTLVQLLQK